MRRITVLLAVLSLLAAAPSYAASPFEAGVRAMYWFPDLSANVKTTTGAVTGEFNAERDLGVGDENIPAAEAFMRFGRTHFRIGYTQVEFDGNKALAQAVTFNGVTFAANDNIVSNLDLKMLDADFQFDLLRPDVAVAAFNLGFIVKVKYVDGTVQLRNAAQTQIKDFKAPIPMVGLAAGVGLIKDLLRADARVTGVSFSGNHLFEGDAFLSFAPMPFLRLQGGYRIIDLKIDEDDIVADLELKGPYLGAQLSF